MDWPIEFFQSFAIFCQTCENSSLLPAAWRVSKQVHLNKAGKGVRVTDGSRDVASLRPLTIFSCFYRLWSSARLASPDARAWLDTWWPAEATGGRKGKEAIQALGPLIAKAASNEFLVSLDYTKAFDHVDPCVSDLVFRKFGMPPNIACILKNFWSHQSRFLVYDGQVLSDPIPVAKSLPQGDAWSLVAMVAVLTPATWQIRSDFPDVTLRPFIDDRTWCAKTVEEALMVDRAWDTWSKMLGLCENKEKSQFYHRTASGRAKFCEFGVPERMITGSPCILGVCLTPAVRRKCTLKEQQRIDDSCRMISRAGFLPLPLDGKMNCINLGPMSKLSFGWFMQVPTLVQCNRVEQCVRRALHEPFAASKHLARLIRGHFFYFNFRACDASLSAAWRFVQKTASSVPSPWLRWNGWADALSRMLARFDWIKVGEWKWNHPVLGFSFSLKKTDGWRSDLELLRHNLRESWRRCQFRGWLNGGRRDAMFCQNAYYEPKRFSAVRKAAALSRPARAVLTGASVSPAAYESMRGHRNDTHKKCPFCHRAIGTLEHVVWHCRALPDFANRPGIPRDALQKRLAWPMGRSREHDDAVLAWHVHVRKVLLDSRYE